MMTEVCDPDPFPSIDSSVAPLTELEANINMQSTRNVVRIFFITKSRNPSAGGEGD